MRPAFCLGIIVLIVSVLNSLAYQTENSQAPLTAEQIVARHLQAIGTAQARAAVRSRKIEGPAEFKLLVGGAGMLDGKSVLVSEGRKLVFLMKFPNTQYRGEKFVCDGEKTQVAATLSEQTRSSFGEFIYVQNSVLREGLLGGVLSTAWPLLNLDDRKPKLAYGGSTSFDGQKVYDIRYEPHKRSDLTIHLYFDPESFRHVATVYSMSLSLEIGRNEIATARQQEARYRLEERFRDFKTVDGLALPTSYNLHFTQETENGQTSVREWDIKLSEISNNISLDPRNFEIR